MAPGKRQRALWRISDTCECPISSMIAPRGLRSWRSFIWLNNSIIISCPSLPPTKAAWGSASPLASSGDRYGKLATMRSAGFRIASRRFVCRNLIMVLKLCLAILRRATAKALFEMSVAIILHLILFSRQYCPIDIAITPEPVPMSKILMAFEYFFLPMKLLAASIRHSVAGRGTRMLRLI